MRINYSHSNFATIPQSFTMVFLNIVPLVGPCFVIIWLSFILYGLVLAQVYFYFATYEDHILIKAVVVLLCLLETLQVSACIHLIYTYLIVFFANPLGMDKIIWSVLLAMYLEVIINTLAQTFYIYRIWRLYRKIPLVIYLIVLLSSATAVALACSIPYANLNDTWLAIEGSDVYRKNVIASLSLGVALDLSITLSLTSIMKHSLAFAHKRSNKNTLHKLMFYALGIGSLTTITTTVTLILFVTLKSPLTYGGMVVILSKGEPTFLNYCVDVLINRYLSTQCMRTRCWQCILSLTFGANQCHLHSTFIG
ncbi:hypothetical protein BDY19DRAFT_94428 [Irpex rosettiformis]|uniref:Uncharacterized protein n=1 Tax=Irpex rosettiformis TaxID=378272 RepID=A0ACB8U6X5_9APHY|nr:hypothetical protein BDY19DRAFT_94428 [Irpex rosettiformis]